MNKVQEKMWLAVIFVGKRVILAFSLIGVVYFAVWLTYQKIVFEPKINELNYEVTLLQEEKEPLDTSLQILLPKMVSVTEAIALLEPELQAQIERVTELKELCIILGIPNPIPTPMDTLECKQARDELKQAQERLANMEDELKALEDEKEDLRVNQEELDEQIADIDKDINKIEKKIRDFENKNHNPIIGLYILLFGAV
jgi:predicted  nucleic acid-binding Zn-ribbon protein